MIINAEDKILGRIATVAAKQALLGEKVNVVNCEKAIITGKKEVVLAHYKTKADRGVPRKGPYIHRGPDRFVRRAIRGMLPYKKPRGKEAFENIMCHVGVPKELEGKETTDIKEADVTRLTNLRFIYVKQVCENLGVKS